MTTLHEMRDQRTALAREVHDLVNKTSWNAATDQPVYDAKLAQIDELDGRISRIHAANQRLAQEALTAQVADASARIGQDSKNEGARIFAKWLRGGAAALTADEIRINNTMSTTTTTEGGFTVATEVAITVVDALKIFGGVRAVATVLKTAMGNPINLPTSTGTSEVGEILAQNTSASNQDPSFGVTPLVVYKYSSKTVAIPFELLQDSNIDIEAFVRQRLVTRLGRITNSHFTVGTGTNQPTGLVTAATVGFTAANATSQVTAVTYASLLEVLHSVDPAYRQRPSAGWMFADSTLKGIRSIVDGQGRPIFVPGWDNTLGQAALAAPAQLLGFPITINQDCPAMAASARSILFGDFSAYCVRDTMEVEMFRFTDSIYSTKGQVGFLAFMRSGGNLLDTSGAVKVFVNAAS